MAASAADWQTAVFRRFKIQAAGVAYNDFLPTRNKSYLINITLYEGIRRRVA
jgi:hypothetical protein